MASLTDLTVSIGVRERNRWLTGALLNVLSFVSPWLSPERTVRVGNRILRLYRVETRIGEGAWETVDHGITMEAMAEG